MTALPTDFNAGGSNQVDGWGRPSMRDLLNPLAGVTLAELKAIPSDSRREGLRARVGEGFDSWIFRAASALTGDDLLVVAPTVGTGRWVREPGPAIVEVPISFATADAAAILTGQAGVEFQIDKAFWRITANWTGGTNSAIGLSSSKATPTDWTTKGDVHGGAGGDVAATLVASAGLVPGTIGVDMDTLTKTRGLVLKSADTIRFDRIVSAFTAGAGFAVLVGTILKNPGA